MLSSSVAHHPLVAVAEAAIDGLPDEELQRLIALSVRRYVARVEAGGDLPIVPADTLTATDAMIATTALLRAVNVQLFELGLWQAWTH